jgi:hypothetical protein
MDSPLPPQVKSYEGHQLPVSALSLSHPPPDSKLATCSILTGSGDKTIIIGSLEKEESQTSLLRSLVIWSIIFLFIAFFIQNGPQMFPQQFESFEKLFEADLLRIL